jgi:hypothetical protein
VVQNEDALEELLLIAFRSVLIVDVSHFSFDDVDEEYSFFWRVYCIYVHQQNVCSCIFLPFIILLMNRAKN